MQDYGAVDKRGRQRRRNLSRQDVHVGPMSCRTLRFPLSWRHPTTHTHSAGDRNSRDKACAVSYIHEPVHARDVYACMNDRTVGESRSTAPGQRPIMPGRTSLRGWGGQRPARPEALHQVATPSCGQREPKKEKKKEEGGMWRAFANRDTRRQ